MHRRLDNFSKGDPLVESAGLLGSYIVVFHSEEPMKTNYIWLMLAND